MSTKGKEPLEQQDWSSRQAIGFALAMIFLVAFVVPVAASGAFLDWVQFLKEYQTLIGGVAAVLAAYITVHHMQVTDQAAERRHRELLALTMRTDFHILQRGFRPQLEDLQRLETEVSEALEYSLKLSDAEFEYQLRQRDAIDIIGPVGRVVEVLERQPLLEAEKLFPGELAHLFKVLRHDAIWLRDDVATWASRLAAGDRVEYSRRWAELYLGFVRDELGRFVAAVEELDATIPERLTLNK